jgi:hypothetical protein
MKHITKILAVVMAIVLLSGQVVYAYGPPQPFQRLQDLHRKVTDKIIEGARKIEPYARKIALYSVPAVGIVKIARDPALRDKIREVVRKIGPYLVPATMGIAGIAAFRKPLKELGKGVGNTTAPEKMIMLPLKRGMQGFSKPVGNITGKIGMQGFSKLGGNITGKIGMQGFSKLGGNITGLNR